MGTHPKDSMTLIREAVAAGETSVALADGDAWVADRSMFADRICPHSGCTAVFDHFTGQWANGRVDYRTIIEARDDWQFESCPRHSQTRPA